jgi:Protein of unknown function (DUF3352)
MRAVPTGPGAREPAHATPLHDSVAHCVSKLAPNTLRHRWTAVTVLLAALAVAAVAVVLGGGGSASPVTASGAAAIIPGDALAYVEVSLDRRSPAVRQALAVAGRFPGFGLAGGSLLGRFDEVLAGGQAVDYSSQVAPWIGPAAGLALLNTQTSTAGSVIVAEITNRAGARSFVRAHGARPDGSYRDTPLWRYPDGNVLALAGSDLVIGQEASVRAALDAAAGARPSLNTSPAYRRALSAAPSGGVVTAYASPAGVRRVLAGQGGVLGALGGLLSQPSLQGVSLSLVPTASGARVTIHRLLGSGAATSNPSFTPALQRVIPAGAALMLDVDGLPRALPQVLGAGSATGLASGIGPLLAQLGTALSRAGVDVHALVSQFSGESAVAILGSGRSASLVIVSALADQTRAQAAFAQFERAMGRIVPTSGGHSAARSVFRTERVSGLTVHAFQLTPTLALDYTLFKGMVVVATTPSAIAEVAASHRSLATDPSFGAVLSGHPGSVTSLAYANVGRLVGNGLLSLSGSSTFARLLPDLERIGGVGVASTRGPDDATTVVTIQIR